MSFCIYYDEDGLNGVTASATYSVPQFSPLSGLDYFIDFGQFMFNLIPSMYRPYFDGTIWKRLKLFKYLQVIFGQLQLNYDSNFLVFRKEQLYLSNVNAQTIVLEKYLRDKYNDCGIIIENNFTQADVTYIYKKEEIQLGVENYIYNPIETPLTDQIYLFNSSELVPENDFTVYVPAYIIETGIASEQFLRALIQQYIYIIIKFNIVKI